jgi:hypothetical protein
MPRTLIERLLADIWCALLNIDSVGIDDNFFALGGDSLTAMRFVARFYKKPARKFIFARFSTNRPYGRWPERSPKVCRGTSKISKDLSLQSHAIQLTETEQRISHSIREALDLVRNEFAGLDPHRQYRNAFSRLLKPDPLGRVPMMGTDQRDMFAPELRRVIETSVPNDGHIFDFGAGDGQPSPWSPIQWPQGTRVSIEEPNPEYLANYRAC